MAIILTDILVGEGLATPDQVRAAMATCGKDESRLPSALAAKGLLYGEKLEALYELAACRASEDAEGAGAAKMRLRRPPSPPTPPSPPPPEVEEARKDPARSFGPFTLVRELGRGGRTVVHRAWRVDPSRWFAVKIFPAEGTGHDDHVRAALQIAGKLHHSRIVRVHDSGTVGGRTFLCMDPIEGRPLAERMKKEPVPWKAAAEAVADTAMAMQVAHDHGIVHRNLSPDSLLIDASGHTSVLGFGRTDDSLPDAPLYRSPEQIEGRIGDVDGRSDVYALGSILYHAVVGAPPFAFNDFGSFFDQVRTARADLPSKRLPGLPPELDAIILRCLEKKPADRYGRAFDLAVDLKRILRGLRPLTSPPPPPARRKAPEIDELTGLRSRRTLLRDAEAATGAPFSMVLFDVDQFRSLNDRDGADLRVRKLAGLFGDLPGSGGLAGRHGADSFLCVLPGVDHAGATAFAEKIRAAVPQIGVTISAGVASAPADGVELRTVLRAARQALVQAKQAGRDRVVSAAPRQVDLSTLLPPRALLGREGELSAAAPLFESIRRGRPAMMMVDGEPGSGKTRLLQELRDRAKAAGLLPVSLAADDAKRTVPGAVLLSLIQEFYARREESRKNLRDKLTQPQRYVLRDAVPCFRSWPPEVPAPEARDHEAVLSQAIEAAVRAIAGEIPVLLLLDNAPAGDRTSFTILRELFRGGSLPLGLVAALKGPFAQIDEKSADPAMLALWFESGRHGAKLLRTPPLPSNQIEMLLHAVLQGAVLPEGFAARLAETSYGNPLYVEAALRGLGARGKISHGPGGWNIAPITAEDLPPTLDQAVRQLVDGLSPGAADLLNYAAVMSVVIDVDALQALGSWREAEVHDLLDLLEDRGLVRADAFSSGTLREAILRTLPPARLPEMRAKTAQVLKDLYGISTADGPAPVPAPAAPPPPPPPPPSSIVPSAPALPAAPAPIALGDAGLDAAIRFLQAIATELKIGRLYPKENRLRVEAREKLAQASRELTTISPRVTFAVGPQGVRVNDATLPPAGEAAARSFAQVLQEKSFGALSLDRGVTPADLGQLLDALAATTPHAPPPHVVLTPASAPLPETPRTKPSELEENARAMIALPPAKLVSLETEKELTALFNVLIEAKLPKLMEPIVDRVGAALRDPEVAVRRQASAMVPRVMEQVSPAARELLIRRLETPLAAAAVAEPDDLTLALIGNAVRSWISTAWTLKQHRLLVAFASRLAFSPDFFKRAPVVKSATVSTLSSMGTPVNLEVIELISRGEPSIREGASRLGAMLGASMVHPLVSLILTSGDTTVRRLAALTLKEIGDGSRQLAAQVKLDTPPNVVRNVLSIYEIPAAGGGDVMAVMRVAAAHPDATVREATGALLIRAKNLFSPLQLSELLDRPDNVLQKSAITAAKDLKAREAGAGVLKIAETTQDEEILRAACNYFRECPTEESLPLLSKLFSSRSRAFGLLKGMSDPTRVAATEALRRLNHPDAKKLLDLAQSDSSETVRRAAKLPPQAGAPSPKSDPPL